MKELLKAKNEFRKKGVILTADKTKSGAGGTWKFAGEDNLIKTIQDPLTACGLELITTMEYLKELNVDTVKVGLFHVESGESIESQISLPPIIPKKDSNGYPLYLAAEIERGKQFGYWSRILAIRILGLSDIDPEDSLNMPQDISEEAIKKTFERFEKLLDSAKDKRDETIKWANKRFGVDDYKKMSVSQINEACNLLTSKAKSNVNT